VGTDALKGKGRGIKNIQKSGTGKAARWRFRPLALIVLAFSVMVAAACGAGSGQSSSSREEFLVRTASISADESNDARFISGAKEAAKDKGWMIEVVDADGSAGKANTAMRGAPVHENAPGPIIGDPG